MHYKTKMVKLNSGHQMPMIGLGTYLVKERDVIFKIVDAALEAGYRAIDTAQFYQNETYIGEALKEFLPKYKLKREDIFLTTKLATTNQGEKARQSIETSLKNLQTPYLDLLLIHWPGTSGINEQDPKNVTNRALSWQTMEKMVEEGKLKSIGVSNYMIKHLEPMMKDTAVKIKPAVNQCEFHPYLYTKELLEYCKEHGIAFEAYSSLGSADGFKELTSDGVVNEVAKKHSVSTAKVLLRWPLQHDVIIIPKSSNPTRVKDNIDLDGFSLDAEDMKRLDGLNRNKHWCWDPNKVI